MFKERNIYSNANYTTEIIMQFESQTKPSYYSNTIIKKFTAIPKDLDKWINQEITNLTYSWIQPEYELFPINIYIQFQYNETKKRYILAEEISGIIDDDLKTKAFEDEYLSNVLINSIIEIKKYLEKKGIRYKLKAFIWNDIEDSNWQENIISIKIPFNNNEEKNQIWEKISSLVEKYETDKIAVLTEIKKL